jgi:hypothetical protein
MAAPTCSPINASNWNFRLIYFRKRRFEKKNRVFKVLVVGFGQLRSSRL